MGEGRNGKACHLGEEGKVHSRDQEASPNVIKDRPHKARYFVIKCFNHENIQLSINNGLWATQIKNELILEEAFKNSVKVILIFSVNKSGFFQGYAQMMSSVGGRRDGIWGQGSDKNKPWGRSFHVKWLRLHDLPFQKTLHLINPWNENKPVKVSRDCQELPQAIGEPLCQLLDEGASLLYQQEAEAGRYHFEHMRKTGMHHPQNLAGLDGWGFSGESCLAGTLSEDDILEMTYEEYLEAYRRGYRILPDTAAGTTQSVQKSSSGSKHPDDSHSGCISKKRAHR